MSKLGACKCANQLLNSQGTSTQIKYNKLVVSNERASLNQIKNSSNVSNFNIDTLKCIYTNAESLTSKIDELRVRVNEINPDIIFVTETWIQEYDQQTIFSIPGYSCRYFCNSEEIRSGVCIAYT